MHLLQHPAGDFALKVTYLPTQTQVAQAEQEVRALRALQEPYNIQFVKAVLRNGCSSRFAAKARQTKIDKKMAWKGQMKFENMTPKVLRLPLSSIVLLRKLHAGSVCHLTAGDLASFHSRNIQQAQRINS